jgi:hypothetical protein
LWGAEERYRAPAAAKTAAALGEARNCTKTRAASELSQLTGGHVIASAFGKLRELGVAFDDDHLGFHLIGDADPFELPREQQTRSETVVNDRIGTQQSLLECIQCLDVWHRDAVPDR